MRIKKLDPAAVTPSYAKPGDAGLDLTYVGDARWLHAGERFLASTGIALELPPGTQGEVRSRSGLAAKHGVVVLNSPGTVDEGYRGEVKVILTNTDPSASFYLEPGMKIAQLVVMPYVRADVVVVNDLSESERGEGGFGSTGIK